MEETAYLGVYCRRWGIPLLDGGTVRLPRLVGQGVVELEGVNGAARFAEGIGRHGDFSKLEA
jgi:enoyl-CoA hydratase/carnithine racemase